MRISDWSSDVCSSDLGCPISARQLVSDATTDRTDDVGERIVKRTPLMGLDAQGIRTDAQLHWNLLTAPLVEAAVIRGEGHPAPDGPLVVSPGRHTGRSANDKFTVRDAETAETRSEEHTSELQSLMRNSHAGICL